MEKLQQPDRLIKFCTDVGFLTTVDVGHHFMTKRQSIWTQKSKSNTLTPKDQLADILTKGNFTRDERNHFLCLFNISQFSSTNCSEVMSKRTQKDSSEERVTAKSKPTMNLVSRCSERTPDVLASTASESLGKPDMNVNYL